MPTFVLFMVSINDGNTKLFNSGSAVIFKLDTTLVDEIDDGPPLEEREVRRALERVAGHQEQGRQTALLGQPPLVFDELGDARESAVAAAQRRVVFAALVAVQVRLVEPAVHVVGVDQHQVQVGRVHRDRSHHDGHGGQTSGGDCRPHVCLLRVPADFSLLLDKKVTLPSIPVLAVNCKGSNLGTLQSPHRTNSEETRLPGFFRFNFFEKFNCSVSLNVNTNDGNRCLSKSGTAVVFKFDITVGIPSIPSSDHCVRAQLIDEFDDGPPVEQREVRRALERVAGHQEQGRQTALLGQPPLVFDELGDARESAVAAAQRRVVFAALVAVQVRLVEPAVHVVGVDQHQVQAGLVGRGRGHQGGHGGQTRDCHCRSHRPNDVSPIYRTLMFTVICY
ncbi:hypothetical protein AGLY_001036 [Aphis glycines]|uniref:Uncharacterized protein n=1 Tax=Aphis glycines TaxID=307491 RepID=A0A6G0U967_APHGL|nr:hypothetical protein AGLY_001036 [Aphis glycines]